MEQDKTEEMLKCFANAKKGAEAKNDTKTIEQINGVIDNYYNKFIMDEMEMVDPEENDYTYVVEACQNALAADPDNPRLPLALCNMLKNEQRYDEAIQQVCAATQQGIQTQQMKTKLNHLKNED